MNSTLHPNERLTEARRFVLAPMMKRTDPHFRYLFRLISRRALLFTEMITARALLFGPHDRLLAHDPSEHPVACQLGGADPVELQEAAHLAALAGFDEINLNLGCPSPRVEAGAFGVSLLLRPDRAFRAMEAVIRGAKLGGKEAAAQATPDVATSAKVRIGCLTDRSQETDDESTQKELELILTGLTEAGADAIYVHGRKAWLDGLDPAGNRTIPPLRPDLFCQVLVHFRAAGFSVPLIYNGGLSSMDDVQDALTFADGVMVGRSACDHPFNFRDVDSKIFGQDLPAPTRLDLLQTYGLYLTNLADRTRRLEGDARVRTVLYPAAVAALGLFHGVPVGKTLRREWLALVREASHNPQAFQQWIVQLGAIDALPTC